MMQGHPIDAKGLSLHNKYGAIAFIKAPMLEGFENSKPVNPKRIRHCFKREYLVTISCGTTSACVTPAPSTRRCRLLLFFPIASCVKGALRLNRPHSA
ncbi:hypothetical protein Holit_00997 [Hollandina sp. SP2]